MISKLALDTGGLARQKKREKMKVQGLANWSDRVLFFGIFKTA